MRTCKLLLLVAWLLPAQVIMPDCSSLDPFLPGYKPTPCVEHPIFRYPISSKSARVVQRESLRITLTATHQPPAALASQLGRVPRGIALYEVIACGQGSISTARIRQALAPRGLTLLAPSLGVVVAERERAKGWSAALGSLPDLAPLATLGMAAAGAPQAGTIAAAGVSALIAGFRAGRDPRPVAMADPVRLTIGAECASYLTLARWPSRGRGPEVVTVEIR